MVDPMCHKVINLVQCSAPIGLSGLWMILYSLQIYWRPNHSWEKLRAKKLLSVTLEWSKMIWTWRVLSRLSKICSAQALSKSKKILVCWTSQIDHFRRLKRLNSWREVQDSWKISYSTNRTFSSLPISELSLKRAPMSVLTIAPSTTAWEEIMSMVPRPCTPFYSCFGA